MFPKTKSFHFVILVSLLANLIFVSSPLAQTPASARAEQSEDRQEHRTSIPTPAPEDFVEKEKEPEAIGAVPQLPSLRPSREVTPTIYLKSRQFQPSADNAFEAQAVRQFAHSGSDRVHVLVQLDFIPREAAKSALAARGLNLLAYVPDNAWIASIHATNAAEALNVPGMIWAGALTAADKLDPAIRANTWSPFNRSADGIVAVNVMMHKDESLQTGEILVEALGGKVMGFVYGLNMMMVELPESAVNDLALADAVQWIEPAAPPLEEANDGIRGQIGVDTVNAAPYNLDGTGIDVMIYDAGRVGAHIDFGTRLTDGDTASFSEHATHVAGIVGGSGANSASEGGSALQWQGMAPNVDLITFGIGSVSGIAFYEDPSDIESDWAQGQNWYGADIGNGSLSSNIYSNYPTRCDLMGKYGASAVLLDQIVRGGNTVVGLGDKYIATWAVGNERGWGSSCGTYAIISPPAAAKNPIQVGGSNTNNNTQYAHTSWGPTEDGRIKPIVTAGGCQTTGDNGITSTDNDLANTYTEKCGTSMAAPAVAGGLALMLQHYRDVYGTSGNFWPATGKAILIQTADDLGNPGPDYQWGFGQVDIHAAVDLISRKAFRQENIEQDEVDLYYFIVGEDTDTALVTLAWDDYEATSNANPTLINNLDLELVAPSGTIWRPWVLNPASPTSNATRGVDSINNQELVEIPSPEIGTWMVRVSGTTVPQGPQDYALVCEGCQPLDVGVCQVEVGGSAITSRTNITGLEDGGTTILTTPEPNVSLTAGEIWQRALEAQTPDTEKAHIQASLSRLAEARATGPEAVVAVADTLRGPALDLAMDEIAAAKSHVFETAPPPPETAPVSAEAEVAALAAQREVEAANRDRAFASLQDSVEGQADSVLVAQSAMVPASPNADRTVGSGCTYATIADAVAAADPNDRLLIEGGVTFIENLSINKNLTLVGGYNGCASGSSARTVIDGNATDTVIAIASSVDINLENLNLTNGSSSSGGGIQFGSGVGTGTLNLYNVDLFANTAQVGGGIWVGPDADLVGSNVEIYNNSATIAGGGLRLYGGRATFSNSSNIYENTAPIGGGVAGVQNSGFSPELNLPSDTDINDNQALTGSGLGGGVYLSQGTMTVADCSDIQYNDAIAGGGVYLIDSTLTIDGFCSEIHYNTATGDGGGVYAQGSTINLDDEAELYNNEAGTDGSGSGGGAYLDDSKILSDKSSIWLNRAGDYGGGVYATNASTVDMDLGTYTCLGDRCSRLYGNVASDDYGGGIYADDSTVWLDNTFVESNSADLGGGVYATNTSLYIDNSLFARNDSTSGTGDAIRLYTGATMTGVGNTFARNNSLGTASGRAIDAFSATLDLGCSIVWGHSSSITPSTETVTYSDIEGGYTGVGNIDQDPLFVATGSYDYHLQSTSPAIDRCPYFSGLSPDFDNEVRPVVRVSGDTPYDMGADEATIDRVGVNGSCSYGTIQQAVNAAANGDTVRISAGIYFESVDIENKNITLAGGFDSTCTSTTGGVTRLEGSAGSSSAIDINFSTVTLQNLEIAWGKNVGGGLDIRSNSEVTLDNTDVFQNHGTSGGGVYIAAGSVMTTTNDSDIYDNTASGDGGGALVYGEFYGTDTTSDITNNCARNGGGLAASDATIFLEDSDVQNNVAAEATGYGGGLYLLSGSSATLTGNAWVKGHDAYDGGGIYVNNATLTLDGTGAVVVDNSASHYGGGLHLANNSVLNANGARIGYDAHPDYGNEAIYGAGLYVDSSTLNFNGTIYNNIASSGGAGIYATGSTVNLTNATVGGTGSNEPNQISASGHYGPGLYLTGNTQATLNNTLVAGNVFQTTGFAYGGGAYVSNSTLSLTNNSYIQEHTAPSLSSGRGAGIYASGATITLDNSQIISNTAGSTGGAVRMLGTSTLNVTNGSAISNNQSNSAEGGGIAAIGTPDINVSNSTLHYNHAAGDGGAIHMDAGTLDFTGWWDLRWNDADGNGGAVAIEGTGDADFEVDGANSYLAVNHADGNGGALYITNSDTVEFHAIDGNWLQLNTNTAGGNGAAAFADNGAFFDIYGNIQAASNIANGNGGVFYLSGGSTLWLDDYGFANAEFFGNRANQGGAIYAVSSPRVDCDGAEFGSAINGNQASAGSGGAIYLEDSTFSAENCTFQLNSATLNGGAIAATGSSVTIGTTYPTTMMHSEVGRAPQSPDAPLASNCDPLATHCSSFNNNMADSDANNSGNGGGIYVYDSTLQIDNTYLHHNSSFLGGAIYQTGSSASADVTNSVIYSNSISGAAGAGIRVNGGSLMATHITLAHNNGPGYSSSTATSNNIYNSVAWGNTGGGFVGTFAASSCNIDQSGNIGTINDPLFTDPGLGETYYLEGASPAIDACVTGLATDLDGISRPAGSDYDMGAYEYASGIEFAPDDSGSSYPTGSVSYVHTLTNRGTRADTILLSAASSQGWPVTISPSSILLAGGQTTSVTITVGIPAGTPIGTIDTTIVTASSSADPTLSKSVTDTTTALIPPDIDVNPLALNVTLAAGTTTTQTLTIRNLAASVADLVWALTESPEHLWLSESALSGSVPGDGNTMVTVSFNTTGLYEGVYTTTLQISSNDPDEPQINIPVTLTVGNYIYLPVVIR